MSAAELQEALLGGLPPGVREELAEDVIGHFRRFGADRANGRRGRSRQARR